MSLREITVVAMTAPGAPDVLVPATRQLSTLEVHEVCIRVAAAGVNRPDVLQRRGVYPPPQGAPDWPGLEVSGEVVALGAGATKWKIGDKLTALVAGGGYATYANLHEDLALPIPQGFSMVEAAALPETFFTVWANVFMRGKLQAGEWILIHGGSSGIGTTAIQLAKAFGAKIIVTVGSADKAEACLKLGADVAINYRLEDFVEATMKATNGVGANLILDMVAGDYAPRNLDALAPEGRIVIIATQNGRDAHLNLWQIMQKRAVITGSTLRPRTIAEKATIAKQLRDQVWPLLDAGKIRPLIYKTFPLHEASRAHELMESSAHIGKIMLTA